MKHVWAVSKSLLAIASKAKAMCRYAPAWVAAVARITPRELIELLASLFDCWSRVVTEVPDKERSIGPTDGTDGSTGE